MKKIKLYCDDVRAHEWELYCEFCGYSDCEIDGGEEALLRLGSHQENCRMLAILKDLAELRKQWPAWMAEPEINEILETYGG